ncbi:MAG: 1-acyl-sn-glycerol-3-phosphate acyltransferase [Clostridiales bacterium]|nr:1-acyl-sn-glycerol-3-phosphate acyltransferase [Clostridiales bacterium]
MKKKKWIKKRHEIITKIAYYILYPYVKLKYNVDITRYKENQQKQYLVLYNHQTAFDQFFVGMALKKPVYYLASEDLFSKGFISDLLRFAVAPIPIKKQTVDISAVKNCILVAKEGGTIAIATEGNRTYSGKTEYMNPAIASLAKKMGLPIMLFRIEGGYGVHPRWSDKVRKGKMKAYVYKVVEPQEYKNLSTEELFAIIKQGLTVEENNREKIYKHKELAQYLERAIYVCKDCGLSTFKSDKDTFKCAQCGKTYKYCEDTHIEGVGFKSEFNFVNDWYEYQKDFINSCDFTNENNVLYEEKIKLSKVNLNKNKEEVIKDGTIKLYGFKAEIFENDVLQFAFDFDNTDAITVLGKNILNVYFEDNVYQVQGLFKGFNALKYVHLFNRYKNIKRGEADVKFLGL